MGSPQPTCHSYQRRQPELTPCYKIVQAEFETFRQERELEGRPLPQYVTDEFEAYLKCGILAHGFLRLLCPDCKHEKITAFSCKKRGFCPSCTGRRQAEAAAHLVDHILPFLPYRQFVITFPFPLRYWINTNKQLFSSIHSIITLQIQAFYTQKTSIIKHLRPQAGVISFTQRWGSALNLNPHLHIIVTDGVHYRPHQPLFRKARRITDQEVATILTNIALSVMELLKEQGYLSKEGEIIHNPLADPLFQEFHCIDMATKASLAGRIAFGPNAGQKVTRIGGGFGYREEIPLAKGKLCFAMNGFSLHAARSINTQNRKGLEQLISYIARGPFSNKRLTLLPGRKVQLSLKRPYSDGTSHILMTYGEFLEKLTALIPPPKSHLVRWSGSFAPNSKYRKKIILNPEQLKGFHFDQDEEEKPRKNYKWAELLARVFGIDVLKCPCGGELKPVAALKDPREITRYLKHVGIEHLPPSRAPPRTQVHYMDFEHEEGGYEEPVVCYD